MRRSIGLLLVIFPVGVSCLQAQTASEPPRGPDYSTRRITPGVEVLPYAGIPFSGTDTIVRSQITDEGASIVTSETSQVVRDGQGKVYRERHSFAPEGVDPRKTIYEFYVLDPIARTHTACTLATHQCTITAYYPQFSFRLMPTGPFDNGRQSLARESLGQQTIDDLPAIGTRETTTISPGTIGNDRALTLTREFWYLPDLKTNIAVTRTDPREGTSTIHLTVLSRSEPDPSIFAVPDGYTVQDARHPAQPLH
jgi:hypothetical protein